MVMRCGCPRGVDVAVLVGCLSTSTIANAAPTDDMVVDDRAQRLQDDAQDLFDEDAYVEAGLTWVRILSVLHENEVNRAERDNALQLALVSFKEAYLEYRDDEPQDVPPRVVEGLAAGAHAYRLYLARYEDEYGDQRGITESLRAKGERIERWYARFESKADGPPPPPPPCNVEGMFLCDDDDPHQNSGIPYIIAGST